MRLLFVHRNLGDAGGAENSITLIARELAARGHSVSLLYSERTGRGESRWRELFEDSYCLTSGEADIPRLLEGTRPDIVFVHNWDHLEDFEMFVDSGTPVVRMVHDHSLYCLREYKYNYFTRRICTRPTSAACVFPCFGTLVRNHRGRRPVTWKSYFRKLRELALNRRCSLMLVYSEYQKTELLRNGFDSRRVEILTPMRTRDFGQFTTSYSGRNLVLFAGQIIRGKGVDALVRSLAKVQVPFEAVILGDGNHRFFCERLTRRLGLENKVRFAGYVSQEQSRELYLLATVFAMSSLWAEPFGLAGPEAMRFGIPVVGFDSGAIAEWLQDGQNGFLVPWNDTTQFAARLEQLLRHKDLARRLGANARQSVQRFDISVQIDRLESSLLKTLNNQAQERRALAA